MDDASVRIRAMDSFQPTPAVRKDILISCLPRSFKITKNENEKSPWKAWGDWITF
jgi:hypothetical protein